MVDINKKLEQYQWMSYEEKLNISMNIISNLKDRGNIQAQEIFDRISNMDIVPNKVLDAIYTDFYNSVERIQKEKVSWELHKFEESKIYIQKIRAKEDEEKEDCDWILDWLYDL